MQLKLIFIELEQFFTGGGLSPKLLSMLLLLLILLLLISDAPLANIFTLVFVDDISSFPGSGDFIIVVVVIVGFY